MNRFGAHFGDKLVRVFVRQHLVVLRQRVQDIEVFLFREQVAIVLSFIGADTRLDHHETFVVDDGLEFLELMPSR